MDAPKPDKNSIAVITGGCGGMGLACARRLGRRHALLLADIAADRLGPAADELAREGYQVTSVAMDVTQPEAVASLAEKTRSLGRLDVLVHTAGLSPSMAEPRRVLGVNMVGTALIERAFLPLAGAGTAAILIASSAGHTSPFGTELDSITRHPTAHDFFERLMPLIKSGADAYFISKRGVIDYCEFVTPEWAKRGARIVTISPGMIATPMNELEFSHQPLMKTMLEMTPIPRFGDADEIAAAVEFLASRDAGFITGADLRIDGGVTPLFKGMASRG